MHAHAHLFCNHNYNHRELFRLYLRHSHRDRNCSHGRNRSPNKLYYKQPTKVAQKVTFPRCAGVYIFYGFQYHLKNLINIQVL